MTSSKSIAVMLLAFSAAVHAEPDVLHAPVIATMSSAQITLELTNVHGACGDQKTYYSVNSAGEVVNQDCWHVAGRTLYLTMVGTVLPMSLDAMSPAFVQAVTHPHSASRKLPPSV